MHAMMSSVPSIPLNLCVAINMAMVLPTRPTGFNEISVPKLGIAQSPLCFA